VVDGILIRPLLECSRPEIEDYLQSGGIDFREDASNRDLRYRRNRIRHECLPYLAKHFNPLIVETLAREAGLAREAAGFLERLVARELEAIKVSRPDGMEIPVQRLAQLDPVLAKAALRAAIRESRGSLRGITSRHFDAILRLCTGAIGGKGIVLPGGYRVRREFKNLVLGSGSALPAAGFLYSLSIPGQCLIPEAGVEFCAELRVPQGPPSRQSRAFLDPAALPQQLWLRPRREGDRYGGAGHRKIKKMLIDSRIERDSRDSLPLLATEEAVIWVPGFEPARKFKAKSLNDKCVIITLHRRSC
jgi:tRNA(Ile)-lysidine synthase